MADVIEVPDGYSFIMPISAGGFVSVVELMENSTQIHYAGKIIPYVTPKDQERVDREVNRLRKFAHPGIVGLKELASTENMKVIVMELGEQSLADIVKDHRLRGVLVAREVVYRVMVDVSSALNLMHNDSSGATAHGDVNMGNILLFGGGHFKLCDLGAAETEDLNTTFSVISHLYVSPERMESETGRVTCSSDVWALGIVLHWLLFGEPPFKSQNAARLFREIGSFQVSMIGESCGGEERALLMRMLDPNPETRVTSSQLCSFGVFRCILNTPSALWRLKDADDKEHLDKEEMWKKELNSLKEKLAKSESERQAAEANLKRQEQEPLNIPAMRVESRPGAADGGNEDERGETDGRRKFRRGIYRRSRIGAAAIELFNQKTLDSKRSEQLHRSRDHLVQQKGGAGWNVYPTYRFARQNGQNSSFGSACLEGREGQRVVLEADGREGKRTLKLSQDGETQPVFFTNIPVPFRFAVYIHQMNDAVEIESIEVVGEPQMVGGTKAVPMDE
ncbi:putative protein kinase [Blattamonas nauphoetae]|uniref:Protein kinase domain-containing protein n=1 Tax=Blattamonas nauphoetae TaxID=2049346 RepID=A0ABQ9XLQ5_9EUKA|nr:putative protein kinase [Blattamonas nauphoetae]